MDSIPPPEQPTIAPPTDRFAGTILIEKDESHDPAHALLEYEKWEKYNPETSYPRGIFTLMGRDGVQREYRHYLVVMRSEEQMEYYVVTKQVNDLRSLEPYCPCAKCRASYLNPLKYIWCPYCTRCLSTGKNFTRPSYIEQARQLRDETPGVVASCLSIKQMELGCLGLIIVLSLLISYLM